MTHSTLEYYKSLKNEVYSQINDMHEHSNWTKEMITKEEILYKKYDWLKSRISNIEDMIIERVADDPRHWSINY